MIRRRFEMRKAGPNVVKVFDPGKTFQPSLMFLSKAGAYLNGGFSGAPFQGRLQALPTNISQHWKNFPGTSTLAYYEH